MMGADSGAEIAKALMARCWISAHDEVKDDQGVAVKLLKCDRIDAHTVKTKLSNSDETWNCDVVSLDVGAEIKLDCHHAKIVPNYQSCGVDGLGVEVANLQMQDVG